MEQVTARHIYEQAVQRAMRDHNEMVEQYLRGEIDIASPCGMDREREYIIEAFQKVMDGK